MADYLSLLHHGAAFHRQPIATGATLFTKSTPVEVKRSRTGLASWMTTSMLHTMQTIQGQRGAVALLFALSLLKRLVTPTTSHTSE